MASFSVVNNIASVNATSNLVHTQLGLNKALTRLSSGLRINNSGDDAAGLSRRDDALPRQHARMRDTTGDIVAVKPRVDVDRGGKGLDRAGGGGNEATAP